MTDAERKEILDKIQREIDEKNSLEAKHEKLKELKNNPVVAKYLQLLNEINKIEEHEDTYRSIIDGSVNDSLERRIHFWFRVSQFSCKHKVWIYAGSFYKYTNYKYETDYLRQNSEDLSDPIYKFSYNKYICLECRKIIEILKADWKRFEVSNLVLKINDYIDIEYYQDLYYQFLYHNYDFEDAQNIVVKEFKKNNKTKALINKKVKIIIV